MKTNFSPIAVGIAATAPLYLGIVSLTMVFDDIPSELWFLGVVPIVIGLFFQVFVHNTVWLYLYLLFLLLLNSAVFAAAFCQALIIGSTTSNVFVPMSLVVFLVAGGVYSGYQLSKNFQSNTDIDESLTTGTHRNSKLDSEIVIAGHRASSTTIERVALRIRALTPLIVAIGLNSAQMLSHQAIYWIYGGARLIFVVMFTLGSGAALFRVSIARQTE